ncbi:hypothetical protein [Alkalimonas amylolytica]|uniref:Heat induced stress protein YflT n=1 Tax=Alkalimonas amylolytica TaxID=152573 RepID=A0A1H4E0A4_ALKAM|nr:hypothetical protein [Alkalimonas amylolytica]SEA78441.1 hypothetical protein SAMN04488051_106138 [Alkalimonas amylolytica]
MNDYCHHVSGFFPVREDAESAVNKMVAKGLSRQQLHIFCADTPPTATSVSPAEEAKSDRALQDILVDGAIGTAVGTGVGVVGSVALAATSVTLFVASPLIAPLMLIGWGASIGGLIGAAAGATSGPEKKEGWLADLIKDAIENDQVVLVAVTRSEGETGIACDIIEDSVGKYNEKDADASP